MEQSTVNLLSKDSLIFFGISNSYFVFDGGITAVTRLIQLDIDKCIVLTSMELSDTGKYVLCIDGKDYSIAVNTEKILIQEGMAYRLYFRENLQDKLCNKIIEYHKITSAAERRSEERLIIGLDYWKKFGLSEPVCYISSTKIGQLVKCIISNASLHGLLLTGSTSYISVGENINFKCEFQNPIESVLQKATVMRIENIDANYKRYSVSFIKPVSLTWQQRLCEYMEKS